MTLRSKLFHGLGVVSLILLSGCAEDTVTVSFSSVSYTPQVQALVSGTPTYIRMFYSYDGLTVTDGSTTRTAVVVQPAETVPLTATVTVNGAPVVRDNWATASSPGPYRVGETDIEVLGLPLGHTHTQIAIEFLQSRTTSGGTQYYVVAAACFTVTETLTKEVLRSYLATPIVITKGRTCGNCYRDPWSNPVDVTDSCT
jgi:hypothetical protein